MQVILTGATGLIGSHVLRACLADERIEDVTTITRSPVGVMHGKLNCIQHDDFLNYVRLAKVFRTHHAIIWCLGISQSQARKEAYVRITHDFVVAAANQALQENAAIKFVFVSAHGADRSGKSPFLFARIKGKAEQALMDLPLKSVGIIRPAAVFAKTYIHSAFFIRSLNHVLPMVSRIFPSLVIDASALAISIVEAACLSYKHRIFEQPELKKLSLKRI